MRTIFYTAFSVMMILAIAIARPENTVKQGVSNDLVTFSLASRSITLYEPMMIEYAVHNTRSEILAFDLGRNRKENFRLVLTPPDGQVLTRQLSIKEGIAIPGRIAVQPGQSYRQTLLVNEWFDIAAVGKYKVSVQMITPIQTKDGAVITKSAGANFDFEVLPRDTNKLSEICERLFNQLARSNSYIEARDSATTLGYIKDSVAVPYLERVVNSDKMVERIAIEGLGRINNREAVDALVNILNSQKPEVVASAQFALSRIEAETKDPSLKQQIRRALKKNG